MKQKIFLLILSLVGTIALVGCLPGLIGGETQVPAATLNPNDLATAVVKTVAIRQTIAVLETQIARVTYQYTEIPGTGEVPTEVPSPSPTPRPPTATLAPSWTPQPSFTPIPTLAFTNTPSIPCNRATFMTDVTYPDGTVVAPGQGFTKTWRFKNTGYCAWTTGYQVVFASGSKMSGPDAINFPVGVKPGETVDLSVGLIAPTDAGSYTGYWQFNTDSGIKFGSGPNSQPFWVKITVGSTTLSGTSFVDTFCSAVWKSNTTSRTCPASNPDFTNGSVQRIDNPVLEGGYQDNEPALVTIPNNGTDGYITGRYPSFKINSGDHLLTLIGCMDASPNCTVTFKLSYTIDGITIINLGSWNMAWGSKFQHIDIDLSSLAGQSVQFIFTVDNNNDSSSDDRAFWLGPYIKR
jgi:hypothetical protein